MTAPADRGRLRLAGRWWAACALVACCGAAPAVESVTVQLKWQHQFQFAGYYVALERGYYRGAGLDVHLVEAGPSTDPVREVLAGRAQFGVGTSDLVLHREHGEPVVVLAVIYQHSPLALAIKRGGPIQTIHDLAGHRIMLEPGSEELVAMLRREGLDSHSVTVVRHSFSTADLLAGKVAAMSIYVTDELYEAQAEGLPIELWSAREAGIDFYGDNLFTTEEQLRRHPRQVAAFREATLRGWREALARPEAAIDLIRSQYSRRNSRDKLRFEAREAAQLITPDVVDVGYMYPGRWEHIAETYREAGLIPRLPDIGAMLYSPHTRPRLPSWAVWTITGTVLAIALLSALAAWMTRLSHRLRHSEGAIRELIDSAPTPFIITDVETQRIRYLNRRAAVALGFAPGEGLGAMAPDLYASPVDRPALLRRLQEAGSVADTEVLLRRGEEDTFWALLSVCQMEFEGRPAIFAGFVDLTEQKALQTDLHRALDEVQTLWGLFPICMHCKKIRNDDGLWEQIDAYFAQRSLAEFSHGICPECLAEHYGSE